MVTGISYDFTNLAMSWVSESSQWWRSMAVVVIFGLIVATFLTLVVVPSLYYLLYRFLEQQQRIRAWVHKIYWRPYPFLSGESQEVNDGK